jgi:hypothetical protein
MSAQTAARDIQPRLQCRAVRSAQFAEDEGQGQASHERIARRLDLELKTGAREADHEKAAPRFLPGRDLVASVAGQPLLAARPPADLLKLQGLVKSIEERAKESEFAPAMEWCHRCWRPPRVWRRAWTAMPRCICWAMPPSACTRSLYPEKTAADQISEIDATVALIRARSQQALAS